MEASIEGDFDRLIQNIREGADGSSSGMLNQMWNINLEDREAEFRDDLRLASGIGAAKAKRKVRQNPLHSAFTLGGDTTRLAFRREDGAASFCPSKCAP